MPITRTPIIDDDGTGTTGTAIDNAWKQELYNQIDAAVVADSGSTVTQVAAAGNYDLVTPTSQIRVVRANPATGDVTIYSASAGRAGDLLFIQHIGVDDTKYVFLVHEQTGRPQAMLWNRATSGWTVLAKFGSAIYQWDQAYARWVLLALDMGGSREIPYAAGNYTSNVGSWTTAFGSAITRYDFDAESANVRIAVNASTLAGAPALLTVGGFPFTFRQIASGTYAVPAMGSSAGVWFLLVATVNPTSITFSRADGAAFANGTFYLSASLRLRIV